MYDGTITTADPNLVTTFKHENGSTTYILIDTDGENANPRHDDGNIATLINRNNRTIDIDECDVYGLTDAREHWGKREDLVRRWLAIYHPHVIHYVDYWTAGDSYGWGYVDRSRWEKAMGADYEGDMTPEKAFDQEIRIYELWATGEVYGYIHTGPDGTEDSCWGFLGYDSHEDIAKQATDSPITEEV